jgi:hypothetical protein
MADSGLRVDIAHLFQDRLSRRWCLRMAVTRCDTFRRCELRLVRKCGSIVAACRDKITYLQCDDLFR